MTNSLANARDAALDSTRTHKFPWKWRLSDLQSVPKNGKTVFSCFSCGGGSTMGYKLAGFDVIGNVEIDPRMMRIYEHNHHPRHPFLMDIRAFAALPDAELPEELFSLDVLDGSPPCSVFSTAGQREKGWNTQKVFREGQASQRLDDLFFHFIEVARRIQPKIIIAENVSGLIKGNAKGYVNEIFKEFSSAGYDAQLFLLDAQYMGVPQMRQRTFFLARRKDLNLPKIALTFHEKPILFGDVRSEHGRVTEGIYAELMKLRRPGDKCIADIYLREKGKESGFTNPINSDNRVSFTTVASGNEYRMCDGLLMSEQDFINIQTFPQDYDFMDQPVQYVCGMSVPPVMMAQIASEVYEQWLQKSTPSQSAR